MKRSNYFLEHMEKVLLYDNAGNFNLLWFRRGVYIVLLLKILFIWPELPTFYQFIIESQPTGIGFNLSKFIFLPFFQSSLNALWLLICVVIIAATIYAGRRWLSILVFIISLNYISLCYMAMNNGDKLLNFFVFALIFVDERALKGHVAQMVNNAVLILLKVNLCVVYFLNGYGKIMQKTWWDGSFMAKVWQLDYYVNPSLVPQWFSNSVVCFITAWSVMLFELTFPFGIWHKRLKKWFIPIGLLFHIFIAVFLSLPDFGLTMMVAYLLFVDKTNKVRSLKI